MSVTLSVFERGKHEAKTQIWPIAAAPQPGFLQETKEYIFELAGTGDADDAILYVGDEELEALRSPRGLARWRWTPGFYAGEIDVRVVLGAATVLDSRIVIDPARQKLTRQDFETMVREILEDTTALFALSNVRAGVERGVGKINPPIARLEFLRSRMAKLEQVIREINERPMRSLKKEDDAVPYWRAARATPQEVGRSFVRGPHLRLPNHSPVHAALRGIVPKVIRRTRGAADLDVPEHRSIKSSLETWRSFLSAVAERLSVSPDDADDAKGRNAAWARRCRVLAERINRLLALPLFDDVSSTTGPIAVSSAFRNLRGYQQFLQIHRDFGLGLSQIAGDFLRLPLARTFQLYELWCFLRIVRAAQLLHPGGAIAVAELFDLNAANLGVASLRSDALVTLPGGRQILFKREYREYWLSQNNTGSFSRKMIPDVSVAKPQTDPVTANLLVLDAKYRVEVQLNEALSSLHMYRDALIHSTDHHNKTHVVAGAYILTPHLPNESGDWKTEDVQQRLFHPEYRTTFRFGAVTMRPGMSVADIAETLRQILQEADF